MNSASSSNGFRTATGYASRQYAESLAEFGAVRELPNSGGWLLETPIANSPHRDAMGCYPLFACNDWRAFKNDLAPLAQDLVSVRLVTDPFANVSAEALCEVFPDVCYEFKQHFVSDLSIPIEKIAASHHRRNARKALDVLQVHQSTSDVDLLPQWQSLYDHLVERHDIKGIAKFSPLSFKLQARVPGFIAFTARDREHTCGMTFWYTQGGVAYYHLAAYSDRGYELGASFALFWTAFTHFAASGIRWAALGAGAGTQTIESGLTRFKQGWATGTRPVYFCGRILQPGMYAELSAKAPTKSSFFPVYRV